VGTLWLARSEKRNALDDRTILGIETYFTSVADDIKVVVLAAEGGDFSAGLDLGEIKERGIGEGIEHSRLWHRAFERIQFGKVPVVAVMQGAVIGGGLELAAAAHVRVAERSAYYALPEASRGIFVGGGGSVRIPKLIGVARMTDMMMTGRVYNAEDGERANFAQYLVDEGTAFDKAFELAQRIATNAPLTNYALMHALPRIAEQSADHGFFTEALMSGIVQAAPEAKERVRDFLEGRGAKVSKG
jgi:enoyl-CoA hydratase/carnithine racemase